MAEEKAPTRSAKKAEPGSADAHVEKARADGQAALDSKVAGMERLADFQTVEEAGLSRQAQFSTYSEKTDLPEENPPLGRHVEQELGEPSEGPVPGFKGIAD